MKTADLHCDTISRLYHARAFSSRNSCGLSASQDSCGSSAFQDSCGSSAFQGCCDSSAFQDSCGSSAFQDSCGSSAFQGCCDSLRRNSFHLDLEKMQKSGYLLQNFAMFIDLGKESSPCETSNDLQTSALSMDLGKESFPYDACQMQISLFLDELNRNQDLITQVRTFSDISKNIEEGRISALLTLEEGEVCLGNLDILKEFYELGARMMTFTWNYSNSLGHPAEPADGIFSSEGLTALGFEFLEEMEHLGIISDVSHLSDQGIRDVCRFAKKPFAASHSNARSLCSRGRNLPDELIHAIAGQGGIIGVNYYGPFLTDTPDETGEFFGSIQDTARHIRHIANLGGISCVGLGSDFDGIDDHMELKNCSMLWLLEAELKRCGFHESEIEAVFYRNVLDFYKELL